MKYGYGIILLLSALWAAAPALRAQTQTVSTLSCRFSQVKEVTLLAEKGTSEGVMYFSNGTESSLCWKYTSPSVYGFIKEGARMYLIDSEGRKKPMEQENRLFGMIGLLIEQAVVTGQSTVAPQGFNATVQAIADGGTQVTLISVRRDLKKLIASVIITFDADRRIARRLEMNEVSGDKTTLTFTEVQLDKPLDPAVFQ